jgi:hypothetical protein
MPRKFVFKTTPAFRTALRKLTPRQKASARTAFGIFKEILLTLDCEPTRFTAYPPSFTGRSIPSQSSPISVPSSTWKAMSLLVLILVTTQFIAIDHA